MWCIIIIIYFERITSIFLRKTYIFHSLSLQMSNKTTSITYIIYININISNWNSYIAYRYFIFFNNYRFFFNCNRYMFDTLCLRLTVVKYVYLYLNVYLCGTKKYCHKHIACIKLVHYSIKWYWNMDPLWRKMFIPIACIKIYSYVKKKIWWLRAGIRSGIKFWGKGGKFEMFFWG